jgi:hypothetical protein
LGEAELCKSFAFLGLNLYKNPELVNTVNQPAGIGAMTGGFFVPSVDPEVSRLSPKDDA